MAVKTTFSDLQIVVFEQLMTGASVIQPPQSFVIIKIFDGLLSIQTLLQVAVYVPAELTTMLDVVAPVLHLIFSLQFEAVKVIDDATQRLVFSALITGGAG